MSKSKKDSAAQQPDPQQTIAQQSTSKSGSITALGVRRPVLIAVVNLLIILAGFAAFLGVDVRELPSTDRPIVTVRATLQGASPETMDAEVTSIVESAIARVSGVRNIFASSEEGTMRLRIEFRQDVDINMAANDIREAVSRVERRLPNDIDQLLVIKADDDARAIMQLSAFSNSLSKYELASRVEKDIVPELLSIDGVAEVNINGNQPRTMRIQIDPAKMSGHRIAVNEIITALRNTQYDVPVGSYDSGGQELIVRAFASATQPEDVQNIFIKNNTRLGDIADVFFAPQTASSYSLLNGRVVIGLGIVRQAGSNTILISDEIKKRLEQINARARDYEVAVNSDDAKFIKGALYEVITTLFFAIIIVLVVIATFLGQWRTTLIPAVTMPVALIGTLAAIWALGFSINILTLLALVLATGLIVDDAIVVLENIQRLRAKKVDKMAAAVLGTRQVFFAVLATTITLIAVFLPIAFLPGQTGAMFKEFGIVLAIAVMISSFVAITLCPMMASRLPNLSGTNPFFGKIRSGLDAVGGKLSEFYFMTLDILLARRALAVTLSLIIALGGYIGFQSLQQELLPREDRGALNIFVTAPDGATLAYTDAQARMVEAALQPYKDQGIITDIFSIIGRWDKNRAFISATLSDWNARNISQQQLADEVNRAIRDLPGAQIRIAQGSSLNVRNRGGGLELALLGNDYETLSETADEFAETLRSRLSAINDVRVNFNTSQPELSFIINRQRANDLNVPLDTISQTLRVMVNEYRLLDMSMNDEIVPLVLAPTNNRFMNATDLLNLMVTNQNGELIPLSLLVDLQEKGVSAELNRHAQRRAVEMDIGLAENVPLGDLIRDIRAVANETLPAGMNIIFLGDAATLEETSYEMLLTFVLAFLVIFLVLSAQFESVGSALIVMFTVPFGLAAAVFALMLTGQSLNLYSQIGLVMLIGLMTKNAILLVEFMDQIRDTGKSVPEAVREGVRVRLRPVTMTVLSTVLGALPLILSVGAGAEARNAIGWVIFGGLGLSTLFTLYLAPVGYALIAPFVKPRAAAGLELEKQLLKAQAHDLTAKENGAS
ncbi:MAG: efflux RND transporter permease subunit [Alphaproteobacteria bacterium]